MNNPNSDDNIYMNYALSEAKAAMEIGEVPIGAVVVFDGRVIARAHNMTESLCDATAHAEMQAITSAAAYIGSKYLKKCVLYVTVEPCPMCAAALSWSQIDRLVYGAEDSKKGYSTISEKLLHPKTTVLSGVKREECAQLMKDFFSKLR